jgi:hypothetical protein
MLARALTGAFVSTITLAVTLQAPPPLSSLAAEWQVTRVCASSPNASRESCAGPGVTETECLEAGCCWDPSYVNLPWCFLPNAPADWDAPGPLTAYAANQAAPCATSRRGGVRVAINSDVAAVTCALLPPYVGECDYSYGSPVAPAYGFPFNFSVNGVVPRALPRFRWSPYGVSRGAVDTAGVQVTSEVRLLHSEAAILIRVSVGSLQPTTPTVVSLLLPLLFRDFADSPPGSWAWSHPQQAANVSEVVHAVVPGGLVVASDTLSPAVAAAALWSDTSVAPAVTIAPLGGGSVGSAAWSFALAAGTTSADFGVLVYVGRNATNVTASAAALGGASFPDTWARAAGEWDALWSDAFTPPQGGAGSSSSSSSSSTFSGSLPVITAGGNVSASMARVYYQSALSTIALWRLPPLLPSDENASYPMPRGIMSTAGVQWAVTAIYFWDTSYASPLLYMLEPVGMRAVLEALLGTVDVHAHYALDALSLTAVGPWYAFNDLSAFTLVTAYAAVVEGGPAGNASAFWVADIAGRRAIDWIDSFATAWQALPSISVHLPSGGIGAVADYGLADNLLECVPSYLHGVPALNAANVRMMDATADIWDALGNATRALELRASAASLLPAVLSLYVNGSGYWACAYPNGTLVPVQHVIDFCTVAASLGPILPEGVRAEMAGFVASQLMTDTWMRALALRDPAAPFSDRADHGPWG